MAVDFTDADTYSDDFIAMTRESQLLYLQNCSDAIRALRRQVLDNQALDTFIDRSTRGFTDPTKAEIKNDVAGVNDPANGQTITTKSKAEELWTALDGMS